jgi:ribosomal protein S12 methylthiotransferase accessory factor
VRDDIAPEHYAMADWSGNLAVELLGARPPRRPQAARELPVSMATDSIGGDVEAVLGRLADRGIEEVIAVDLSAPALDVAVTRVIAPGLEGMRHKEGYRPGRRAREAAREWS